MKSNVKLWMVLMLVLVITVGCGKSNMEKEDDIATNTSDGQEISINVPVKDREFVTIKAGVLNVRKEPSKDSKALGKVVQGQDFTVVKTIKDEDDQTWYAVNYKEGLGYLAGWYCIENKSQNIDLLGYSDYDILDAKWLEKDIIMILKKKDADIYKYFKYSVATGKTENFYSDDKKVWNFWNAKNLENNKIAVCLSDRVLVFNEDTMTLVKEVIIQGTDNNEGLYTEYNILYDGSIIYITDHEIRKKNIDNDDDVRLYKTDAEDDTENILMAPRWSAYGTKISSYMMKNQTEQVLLVMDKQGQGIKEIPLENTMVGWLDDKYLFGYNNSNEQEKGFIINSATGKVRQLDLTKYIEDIRGSAQVQNSSLMALYNQDDIYILKDLASFALSKYTLPNKPGDDNLYFNQIGHKVMCLQVKKHSMVLYHLALYE